MARLNSEMDEDSVRLSLDEYPESLLDGEPSPGPRDQLSYRSAAKVHQLALGASSFGIARPEIHAHLHSGTQKENFPPTIDVDSPVSVEPQHLLKSPGHIAKLQLARAAAAQHAQRRSMAPVPATSSESKAVQAVSRRRAAAEWVESLTGITLPTASDAALRGALRDGLLLCKLLNILRPGILPKVLESLPRTWHLSPCLSGYQLVQNVALVYRTHSLDYASCGT